MKTLFPKNVALFASAYHPHVGGVEELVRQLAHAYRREGIGAIVLTNRWPRSLPTFENHEGIPLYRLAMRTPEPGRKAQFNHAVTGPFIRAQMLRILRKHEVDMIHVQCVSSNGYYAHYASKALGLPLVVTAQGERTMDATQIYQHSVFMNKVLRGLLADADYITACSRDTLDDIETYFGTPFGDRASVVYNGIQTEDFQRAQPYAHPRPYVLGIGRLVQQKGFDVLIEAFAKAKPDGWDLLIAGVGSEQAELEKLAASHGMSDRILFPGRADRAMAAALFKGAQFFVLPSRKEPMGIVNLEAMSAGKAVIASRVGGVPEIVLDGETGLLVPAENVDALAQTIHQLASNPELRAKLGNAGSARAERHFTWREIASQYLRIYADVTAKKQNSAQPVAAHGNA